MDSTTAVTCIQFTKTIDNAYDPRLFTNDSVGYDLFTPIDLEIAPGKQIMVDTGIVLLMNPIPDTNGNHLYCQLFSKSGICFRKKVILDGGVIDPGYRGSIRVVLRNISTDTTANFKRGDPIAQMLFIRVVVPVLKINSNIDATIPNTTTKTERGTRGFGGML